MAWTCGVLLGRPRSNHWRRVDLPGFAADEGVYKLNGACLARSGSIEVGYSRCAAKYLT